MIKIYFQSSYSNNPVEVNHTLNFEGNGETKNVTVKLKLKERELIAKGIVSKVGSKISKFHKPETKINVKK